MVLDLAAKAKKMKGLMRDPIFAKVAFRLKRQRRGLAHGELEFLLDSS